MYVYFVFNTLNFNFDYFMCRSLITPGPSLCDDCTANLGASCGVCSPSAYMTSTGQCQMTLPLCASQTYAISPATMSSPNNCVPCLNPRSCVLSMFDAISQAKPVVGIVRPAWEEPAPCVYRDITSWLMAHARMSCSCAQWDNIFRPQPRRRLFSCAEHV